MQRTSPIFLLYSFLFASASAQGLYQASNSAEEPMPLKWGVGANVIFDDNVASAEQKVSSIGFNPALTLAVTSTTPQTIWDVNGRLGLIYYPSPPKIGTGPTAQPIDDLSNQSRLSANLSHNFTERLRFTSNNMASREREPEYAYGIASGRQGANTGGEYISLNTDNSFGFRWTQRIGTVTGLKLGQITNPGTSKSSDSDRITYELHHQFRFQYSKQSVITGDYRYVEGTASGTNSQDSTDHYLALGDEYRFSPNTIGILKAGTQLHDIVGGKSSTSPYLDASASSQVNKQLALKIFTRYSLESEGLYRDDVNYSAHQALRVGVTGDYMISPKFSIITGFDYIPSTYQDGLSSIPKTDTSDKSESLINAYVTASVKFNDFLSGSISYTFTDQTSDFQTANYNRNRISLGLNANF